MDDQQDQWGARSKLGPTAYQPGYSEPYAPPTGAPPSQAGGYGFSDSKNPYEGGRFKPKTRLNDPLVLVLFIAQVSMAASIFSVSVARSPVCRRTVLCVSHLFDVDICCGRGALIMAWNQFVGFVVVSALALSTWIDQGGLGGGLGTGNTGTSITLDRYIQSLRNYSSFLLTSPVKFVLHSHTVYLLLFVAAAGLVLSTFYLVLTRFFTTLIMHVTLILSIALNM